MRFPTFDDFGSRIGTTYDVLVDGGIVQVRLHEAQQIPGGVREGGSFRLVFRGPPNPLLIQAIYRFRKGNDVYEIFVVPIARDHAGTAYEAIFL